MHIFFSFPPGTEPSETHPLSLTPYWHALSLHSSLHTSTWISQTIPLRNCPPLHIQHKREISPRTTGLKVLLKWNGFRILRRGKKKKKKLWISPGWEQAAGLLGEHPASPKQVNYKTMKIIKTRMLHRYCGFSLEYCPRGVGQLASRYCYADWPPTPRSGGRSTGRKDSHSAVNCPLL